MYISYYVQTNKYTILLLHIDNSYYVYLKLIVQNKILP
jgi:hypothetical protein